MKPLPTNPNHVTGWYPIARPTPTPPRPSEAPARSPEGARETTSTRAPVQGGA